MRLLTVSLVIMWILGATGPAHAGQAPPPETVRLYIFTAPAPPATSQAQKEETDLKERLQAVQDMSKWLRDKRKQTVTIVDRREAADAVVEVVAVQHAPGMSLAERTAGYLHGPRYDMWTVRVKVTAGTFSNEVARQGQFPLLAAEGAADNVDHWARTNRNQLIAARPR